MKMRLPLLLVVGLLLVALAFFATADHTLAQKQLYGRRDFLGL